MKKMASVVLHSTYGSWQSNRKLIIVYSLYWTKGIVMGRMIKCGDWKLWELCSIFLFFNCTWTCSKCKVFLFFTTSDLVYTPQVGHVLAVWSWTSSSDSLRLWSHNHIKRCMEKVATRRKYQLSYFFQSNSSQNLNTVKTYHISYSWLHPQLCNDKASMVGIT